MDDLQLIHPRWPAPRNVRSIITTRNGGSSVDTYASLNLSYKVGDMDSNVTKNRDKLFGRLKSAPYTIMKRPAWPEQTHSNAVVESSSITDATKADAVFTKTPHDICGIMTADCLPVFLCDQKGTEVAVAHAGWRGLAYGVIYETVKKLSAPRNQILAYLGPAISSRHYEVNFDLVRTFIDLDQSYEGCFKPTKNHKFKADLYALAKRQLRSLGITKVFGGAYCTFHQSDIFFSFRRDGMTGRMAALIWLE